MKKDFVFYANGSSKNHGCEAITRSTLKIISGSYNKIVLATTCKTEDLLYDIDKLGKLVEYSYGMNPSLFNRIISKIYKIIFKSNKLHEKPWIKNVSNEFNKNVIAVSVGGDNYCYKDSKWLMALNKSANERAFKTVLWGCSIEPDLIGGSLVEDLKRFDLITPRETMTYNALIEAGVDKNTKLYPDPAFQLDKLELPLPDGFVEGRTIGINVSPLIEEYEQVKGSTMKNYNALLQYIIDNTDLQIALIPHVVWDNNNDLTPLTKLFEKFKHTGRVVLIGDHNCMEIKGFISRLRMLIAARTHATVAAYSTCVPTLVVGYSIKAKGIAKDLFGTYENYVIPVQSLANEDDLINAFKWLYSNEDSIRKHLEVCMPAYCARSLDAVIALQNLMQEN